MKLFLTTAIIAVLCSAFMLADANAGESEHKIKIMTVDNEGSDPVVLQFSTDQNLSDLQDGESRVITGENGETVTVTRNDDQLNIVTSTGQEVSVPFMHGQQVHVEHHGDQAVEKHVRVIRKHKGEPSKDIMIMAPGGLSDYEKQVLRDAMTAAGIDKELHFVGDGIDGDINIEIETSD